jgi:hypothetical protein
MSIEIITPPTELFEFFKKRTQLHINLVYKNMIRFAIDKKGNFKSEIETRAGFHDSSKLEKPEIPGWIWLNAYYWLERINNDIKLTINKDEQFLYVYNYLSIKNKNLDLDKFMSQVKQQFDISLNHHYANNAHHPEHHKNISNMSQLDLIEMVCDWTAISQELKQDNGSARTWADKVIGTRFKFSDPQIKFIYEHIDFLDEANKNPLFICKRGAFYD